VIPELTPGTIMLMDNPPVHERERVDRAITAAGCTLVFLPPYPPDFQPIENIWSKVKAILRAAARTFETVVEATGAALRAITTEDFDCHFQHLRI
jgi:transposase